MAAAAAVVSAVPCFAGDILKPKGVVELFTSQGCNSCPPADKVLAELAEKGEVVALGYHVDYWDYLGWKDTLATPENTERQHLYGKAFQERSVYTPQAVINGRLHVNGARREAVRASPITYANPVTSVQTAGMWHGKATRFELPRSEVTKTGGCAILLQAFSKLGLPGPILGAAVVPAETASPDGR
ncbi:MAG: DUF1223 domain-containing protein [Hyphomicrobiales bacterium]|nr:DUF1223 domain-containing protein [Hyphomicrobiales bacterium]